MSYTKERVELARDIVAGRIPEWLIAFWDRRFQSDTERDAKKLLRSQTVLYRVGRSICRGFIGMLSISLLWAGIFYISDIDLAQWSLSSQGKLLWTLLLVAGFMVGVLLLPLGSNVILDRQYWSLDYIKRYWQELPLTKEAARRLADERIIALAEDVLRGQKSLIVDSTDPAERERQMEVLAQQREKEEERMGELSNAFDCFKHFGVITIGKEGGYGGHFAQAKKRLAAASNDEV